MPGPQSLQICLVLLGHQQNQPSQRGILKALASYDVHQKDELLQNILKRSALCQQNTFQAVPKVSGRSFPQPTLPEPGGRWISQNRCLPEKEVLSRYEMCDVRRA